MKQLSETDLKVQKVTEAKQKQLKIKHAQYLIKELDKEDNIQKNQEI